VRSGLFLTLLLPLALCADPIPGMYYPEPPLPPGTIPELWVYGSTPTTVWAAAWESSQGGGDYYVGFIPQHATITSFTAQFTFATASPDNKADFGVVLYDSNGIIQHGTPEDPNNPNIITWDASHQVQTITVPITQFNVTEQIASIELPNGVTTPPQITFLNITSAQVQDAPEPASAWLIALGLSGVCVAAREKGSQHS